MRGLTGRHAHQVLRRFELIVDGHALVSEVVQVSVADRVESEDGRARAPRVLHSRKQVGWRSSGGDHEDDLARARLVDATQVNGQVRRGSGGKLVSDEDGRQLQLPAQT